MDSSRLIDKPVFVIALLACFVALLVFLGARYMASPATHEDIDNAINRQYVKDASSYSQVQQVRQVYKASLREFLIQKPYPTIEELKEAVKKAEKAQVEHEKSNKESKRYSEVQQEIDADHSIRHFKNEE
jgi:acyl-CoA synthetase (AMP-forming)/AMP-acid ligase II